MAQSDSTHKFNLETANDISRLTCSNCQRPILTISNGEIQVLSKHGSSQHENSLTIDHLRMLAVVMYAQLHPPERF